MSFTAGSEDLLLCQSPGFSPSAFLSLSHAFLQKKNVDQRETGAYISLFAQSIWSWARLSSSRGQAAPQASDGALLGQVSGLPVTPSSAAAPPSSAAGQVRSATCGIWFSHRNRYDIWCLRGGREFRLLLICFPVILILNLTQLRGETDTMSNLSTCNTLSIASIPLFHRHYYWWKP